MSDQNQHAGIADRDLAALVIVGVFAAPAIGAIVLSKWHAVIDWLIGHHLLVPASGAPLVTIPRSDGAGLDLPHIILATCTLVAILSVINLLVRRGRRHRQARSVHHA